jgi:peroxiredoxin
VLFWETYFVSMGGKCMPKVALNAQAPEFSLPDFNGKDVALADFRGQSNVLLVFNRGFV